MIHRIRLWLWERKRRQVTHAFEVAWLARKLYDEAFQRTGSSFQFELWEHSNEELQRIEGELEAHEARRPRR